LSIEQRHAPDLFSEAAACAISLYNTAVLGALAIGFSKSNLLSSGPTIALFQQLAVHVCVLVLVSALFGSKMLFVIGLRASTVAGAEATKFGGGQTDRTLEHSVLSEGDSATEQAPSAMTNTLVGGASGGTTMTGGKSNPKLKQPQQHQHRGSTLAFSSLPPNNGSSPGLSPSMPPGRLLSTPATGRNGMSASAFGSHRPQTAPLSVNGLSPMRRPSNNATSDIGW
jgi:hypothetical protein